MHPHLALLVLAASVCSLHATQASPPAPSPKPTATAPAPAVGEALTGQVLERLDAPPYCYLRLATAKGEVWAAVPEAPVKKGATITIANPMAMGLFESKTLKRTFSEVYFGTLVTPAAAPPGSPHPDNPHAQGAPTPKPAAVGRVAKAKGPQARTVAEVWAQKTRLKDKLAVIRGKVMKVNPGVMGKNWIHLQDGSGNAKKGTHDLTFTTQMPASVGDVLTLKGVVRIGKDFGAGYYYEVVVEDAVVVQD